MFEIIAVTNRLLCGGGNDTFIAQLGKIAGSGVKAVILREKDLSEKDYENLAKSCNTVISNSSYMESEVQFIVHDNPDVALNHGFGYLHLSWTGFTKNFLNSGLPVWAKYGSLPFGVSVHSKEEARLAGEYGASWLMAGHIFQTQSKEGLPGRGLYFLSDLCRVTSLPVYAIGGINKTNIAAIAKSGAKGACIMSSFMQSSDPESLVKELKSHC